MQILEVPAAEEAQGSNGKGEQLPPMLRQYKELKEKYSDCLLLFQVGDFYELFFEDAVTVSRTLNLTLTTRDRKNPDPVPMCGVPIAVVDTYAERLIDAGYSVAIVSQAEGPVKAGVAVTRFLERIITPGIRLLGSGKNEASDELVAALGGFSEGSVAIAASNVQSGTIKVIEEVGISHLVPELERMGAIEVILPVALGGKKIDRRLQWVRELCERFGQNRVKFRRESLPGAPYDEMLAPIVNYQALSQAARKAVRLLAQFVDETTVGLGVAFHSIDVSRDEDILAINAVTRDSLELVKSTRDQGKEYTLYGTLDATVTQEGSRMLRRWICFPSRSLETIRGRLASVRTLVKAGRSREEIRQILKFFPDGERIAARTALQVVSPLELASLRDSLERIPDLKILLSKVAEGGVDGSGRQLAELEAGLLCPEVLLSRLKLSLADSPSGNFNEGEIIRPGFNEELDRLRDLRRNGRSWIAALEQEEREKTGIASLKLRFNQAFGFFIEVTKANLHKVPPHYIRKQTTVNGERFTTEQLREREQEILSAESREVRLQKDLFNQLRRDMSVHAGEIRSIGEIVATIDVLSALSEVAEKEGYSEPEVLETMELSIQEGKHPVLARLLGPDFVPNTIGFQEEGARCIVLTGPNMGGKSTFLRQNALIVIMAQIGSFVPARRARIGIVDRIFSRIGASDNMIEGDSTFMVEMREAAAIVRNATERSMVIIDEIGRGTATADGLALAQSILEWLVLKPACRTLFATHFHELTLLEEFHPSVRNLSVGSMEKDGDLIFTHHIREGAASRSYGVEVAKLAGLPSGIIKRAKGILQARQKEPMESREPLQQSLFDAPVFLEESDENDHGLLKENSSLRELAARILASDINQMTPLDALRLLSELREEAASMGVSGENNSNI